MSFLVFLQISSTLKQETNNFENKELAPHRFLIISQCEDGSEVSSLLHCSLITNALQMMVTYACIFYVGGEERARG